MMNAKKNREGTSIISEAEHRIYMLAAVLIAKLKSRVYDIYIYINLFAEMLLSFLYNILNKHV